MAETSKIACLLALSALMIVGCDDDPEMMGTGGMTATGGSGGTGAAPADNGSATLTIGGQTWEFSDFRCAFGYEATQTEVYSFSSTAFGEDSPTTQVQLLADIMDASGQERLAGAGVLYSVTLDDITNFDTPAVGWEAFGPADIIEITIDGDTVTAEGVFDDLLTDEVFEEVPGTLTATCGAQSIR
ncbi:MAG: hypothetical protein AAF500_20870 [Myxococcota bacterium]